MRDRARDVQRHRARRRQPRRAGAVELRRVERGCDGPPASVRSSTIRSYCSVALRTKANPSSIFSVSRGSSNAPRWTLCRYLREMSTTARSISAQRDRLDRRMLQQLFRGPAVAAADDQRALGLRMRDRRDVDEVLVIEELVLLGRHEVAVEAEQLAERHGVVHFDRLERRREFLELARRPDEEPPVVGEVFGHRAGRDVPAGGDVRRPALRHPCRRDGSPGTACAAAAARPPARGTRCSALAVLSVCRLQT